MSDEARNDIEAKSNGTSWQMAWREGFAPQLPTEGLIALALALVEDDDKLIQGATTEPPPLQTVADWPVEAACATGYCFWRLGEGLKTVSEVEEAFARVTYEADQLLSEPGGCRWFLNWFDEVPREEMRYALLPEVQSVLRQRRAVEQSRRATP